MASSVSGTSIPVQCQRELDSWCRLNCPLESPVYHARFGRSEHGAELGWRCYSPSTLDPGLTTYSGGSEYCTRHTGLHAILEDCRRRLQEAPEQPHVLGTCSESSESPVPAAAWPPIESQPLLPPWAEASVRTVTAVDTQEWAPSPDAELLSVLAWSVPCVDKYSEHRLANATGNVSRRKAFLKRQGLRCFGTCVRGVVDGFLTRAEAAELRAAVGPVQEPGQSHASISSWRWNVPEHVPVFETAVARAQAVLEERFGVRHLRFYRSNAITWSGQSAAPWPDAPAPWYTRSLHGDLNTDEMFLYTCILYLSDYGVDVHGGETGIADEVVWPSDEHAVIAGRTSRVTGGLRVEPSLGRLLVFSAGVENMHEMLPVTHGTRVAVQMWFACEGQQPGWAHDQRVEWERVHGYGGPDGPVRQGAVVPPLTMAQFSARRKPWPWR